ncbi:hypothetical protein BO71DRAFT_285622, partial [Aspergillus ellipticus CBS 707.79]
HHQNTPRDTTTSTTFPTAFDTSLTNNFTSTACAPFIHTLLSNTTLTSCHAVSFLLRNSDSFFHTLTSAAATSAVLDTACAANVTTCGAALSSFATELRKPSACGKDYDAGNQLVVDAYTDLITYEPIYRATCLQSPSTTDYCFVDAVTNTSNAVNYDVYFVPFGTQMTSAPWPICTECLQAILAVYAEWAKMEGQPLVESYLPTAEAIDGVCGEGFADADVTVGVEKGVGVAESR